MKVLFATKNKAKISYYKDILEQDGYDVLALKDLDIEFNIIENGVNEIENAKIKAIETYKITNMVCIGSDDGLYIEGLSDDLQPKTHIRRVNSKVLTDQEMIHYYSSLFKTLDKEKINAYYNHALCIYNGKEIYSYEYKTHITFSPIPSIKITEGFPLDSFNYIETIGKYRSEATKEELDVIIKSNKDVIDFFKNTLKTIEGQEK